MGSIKHVYITYALIAILFMGVGYLSRQDVDSRPLLQQINEEGTRAFHRLEERVDTLEHVVIDQHPSALVLIVQPRKRMEDHEEREDTNGTN